LNAVLESRGATALVLAASAPRNAASDACMAWLISHGARRDVALSAAAAAGAPEVCQRLLGSGAQAVSRSVEGRTPLHAAVEAPRNAVEVVRLMLECGASPNAPAANGDTPLHVAAARGAAELVDLLIAAGADVGAVNSKSATPLHSAARAGQLEAAVRLVRAGASCHPGRGTGAAADDVIRLLARKGGYKV
jgi:ankyrin repeat protein